MNNARAQEIRAALDEYDRANTVGTTHDFLLKQGAITVEAPDLLRELLAERDKLVAVVDAAREFVDELSPDFDIIHVQYMEISIKELRDALTALG